LPTFSHCSCRRRERVRSFRRAFAIGTTCTANGKSVARLEEERFGRRDLEGVEGTFLSSSIARETS
jgi:hypothetical protein